MAPPDPSSGIGETFAERRPACDEETRKLLYEVFPIARFRDARYLNWLYGENPLGPAFQVTRHAGGQALAHVGGSRQRYHRRDQVVPAVVPLNLAVSESARGRGLMTAINRECIDLALAEYGDGVLVSVPNASSTPGYVHKLGCRLVMPLPVIALPPLWFGSERVESVYADARYRKSRAFDELSHSLDFAPGEAFSQQWSPELLAWRLRAPDANYALHVTREVVLITTAVPVARIPVCVILKTFARRGIARVRANDVAAVACRFHRAPVALYAGFSSRVSLRGVRLPERVKPAPLNLIVRSLRPGFLDAEAFDFEQFEFLDFDAF